MVLENVKIITTDDLLEADYPIDEFLSQCRSKAIGVLDRDETGLTVIGVVLNAHQEHNDILGDIYLDDTKINQPADGTAYEVIGWSTTNTGTDIIIQKHI